MMNAMLFALLLGVEPATQGTQATTEQQAQVIGLNSASAQAFASLETIDQSTADAIVGLRQKRGRLGSVEELRVLPGMNDARLDDLRANTTVDLAMPEAAVRTYSSADQVLSAFDHEPDVQAVQDMAMRYTHTNREQVERWLRASRNSAWLPEVQLKYNYQDTFGQDFVYEAGPDSAALEDGDTQQRWYGQVQVKWKLDELVMSSTQIRVISESQDVVKLRDTVLTQVTGLYFDRRRLQVDMLLSPPGDVRAQVDQMLRLMELTAELDAFTGGQFSAQVARGVQVD